MSAPNYQRSRQVLQALVQGVDPETSAELTMDIVLNRVDVVCALLAAIEALDAVSARALRRAQLPETLSCDASRRVPLRSAFGESQALGTPTIGAT
jgi:hypothetical protein